MLVIFWGALATKTMGHLYSASSSLAAILNMKPQAAALAFDVLMLAGTLIGLYGRAYEFFEVEQQTKPATVAQTVSSTSKEKQVAA